MSEVQLDLFEEALLPCPLCNRHVHIVTFHSYSEDYMSIIHDSAGECDLWVSQDGTNKLEFTRIWNTRV